MKPSKELLELARAKAKATFRPNKNNTMQSIRLTADETSYELFYQVGISYIGTYECDKLGKFFKNKDIFELVDNNTGKISATMQRL
jgi:hypothetical protein